MIPDTKVQVTICPECGVDLRGRDRRGHSMKHWPDKPFVDGLLSREAFERLRAVDPERADEYKRRHP